MIKGLNHVSIVVPDLDAAARRFEALYGLAATEPKENAQQGVRLAYVELGNARIELMEPLHDRSPVSKFLDRNPAGGIHHFSLDVDSVDAAVRTLAGKGVRILGDGSPQQNVHGGRIAFVHPKDFLGALVELEEGGHEGSNAKTREEHHGRG